MMQHENFRIRASRKGENMKEPIIRVLSLGAGVQSTTMALMAAQGEITPMPDCAIFADTHAEPQPVYEHLKWLMSGNVLPFPVHMASAGSLTEATLLSLVDKSMPGSPPFFTSSPTGREGRMARQCTTDYKIVPIRRKVRELLNKGPRDHIPAGSVEMWIGISADEAVRYKQSRVKYIQNRHPFLERSERPDGLWMTRRDCLNWCKRNGYPEPPRSACTFCPNRNDAEWVWLDEHDPAGFAGAKDFDANIRNGSTGHRESLYLHRSLKPLGEVDFDTSDKRQSDWINECEGVCGV